MSAGTTLDGTSPATTAGTTPGATLGTVPGTTSARTTSAGTGTHHVERARRRTAVYRRTVLAVALTVLLVPVVALVEFSVRFPLTGAVDLSAWRKLVAGRTSEYQTLDPLWDGLTSSLVMCVATVLGVLVLLLPTMVWVRLKARWLDKVLESICLLPLTIPAVVLVVGLAPIYRWIGRSPLGGATEWLALVYVVLVLPFAYRALDAGLRSIDLVTLAEAARVLGAGWTRVLLRVVVPTIRPALVSASFLAVAVVLGEFTIARLLARQNLQTALFQVNLSDSQVAAATSFLALAGTTVLLVVLEQLTARTPGRARTSPGASARTSEDLSVRTSRRPARVALTSTQESS